VEKDIKKKFIFKKGIVFFILFTIFICLTLFYSRYIGTSGIFVKEYKVTYSELSNDFYGLKIAHITDIHYKRTIFKEELENIAELLNLTKPDIVVLTGDLIDKDTILTDSDITILSNFLNSIDASIGKYAIKGNHDYKFNNWDIIIENGGFKNLNDTYELIYTNSNESILLAGVSTNLYGKKNIKEKLKSTYEYLSTTEKKPNYNILLLHEPDFINDIDYTTFNLILAGHSHNGQIRLPIIGAIIKPTAAEKYYDEYYKIKTTDLYISSGIGVSQINFRLFNKPSFNLYRLTNS